MRTYNYILKLKHQIYPRHLSDVLSHLEFINKELIAIKDEQCKEHIYGDTYIIDPYWDKRNKLNKTYAISNQNKKS